MSDREAAGGGDSADEPHEGGNGASAASDVPPSSEQRIAEDEERPAINLERYFSQRKPRVRISMMHVVTLVLMLGALVMIFMFKNRCGLVVANMFEQVSGPTAPADRKPGLPVENPR